MIPKPAPANLKQRIRELEEQARELKQVEEALRKSKAKYVDLYDHAPDMYLLVDAQTGAILDCNQTTAKTLGYAKEEIIGRPVIEMYQPTCVEAAQKAFQAFLETGIVKDQELEVRRRDGSGLAVSLDVTPVRDETGKILYSRSSWREITRRKRAETALREAEEIYRTLVENIQDGMFMLQDDRVIFANEALSQITGYSLEEMRSMAFGKFIVPEDVERVIDNYQRRQAGEEIPSEYEFRIQHKDGSIKNLVINIGTVLYKGKIASIGTVKDITASKRAEKALRESEALFRTVYQTIPDPVTIIRVENGCCVDINDGFTHVTGYKREEVVGKTAQDINIWVDPKKRDRFIADIAENGQVQNLEADFRIKDGSVITGLFSAKSIMLEDKPHILSLTRNISELKLTQKQKEELEAQLRQAQKMEAIGTLAGGIAHDFNNILAAIMGYAEMAQFDLPEANPARFNIDQALKATHRAKDLIKQILAFSRQTKHERKPLQMHLIIGEALKLIRASLPATIEIHQDIIKESGTVLADPIQIHQVVMNLCSNAHHAMRDKGGTLRVSLGPIEIGAADAGRYVELNPGFYVRLTVADTGHGMAPETIDRIFDPYFTTKDREKGTGLGLAVVHGIVKDHGGAIYVESELGKGAVFEILLPRAADELAPEEEVARSFPTGRERILFVDDEELLAELGKNILQHLGYRVVARTNSVEALREFRSDPGRFDLVLTDMTMPKMAGDQLAGELKRIRPDIPILLCTGYSESIDECKADAIGINGFLMKPLSIYDLAPTIREILDKGKLKS